MLEKVETPGLEFALFFLLSCSRKRLYLKLLIFKPSHAAPQFNIYFSQQERVQKAEISVFQYI